MWSPCSKWHSKLRRNVRRDALWDASPSLTLESASSQIAIRMNAPRKITSLITPIWHDIRKNARITCEASPVTTV